MQIGKAQVLDAGGHAAQDQKQIGTSTGELTIPDQSTRSSTVVID